jgi:hypothetical protein
METWLSVLEIHTLTLISYRIILVAVPFCFLRDRSKLTSSKTVHPVGKMTQRSIIPICIDLRNSQAAKGVDASFLPLTYLLII